MGKMFATVSVMALLAAAPAFAADPADTDANTAAGVSANDQGAAEKGTRAQNSNAQDRTFVEKAASGGKAEVAEGELAIKHAVDPAVREFGRWMATDHTEMSNMLAWRAQHAGLKLPATLDQKDREALDKLGGYTGAEFDLHYLADQLEAHKKTLELFKEEADSGENPALKALARRSRRVLEQHLAEVQELQSAPQSSTARSAAVTSPPAPPMQDPKAANPALQNANPAIRPSVNQQGARQIEKEGK